MVLARLLAALIVLGPGCGGSLINADTQGEGGVFPVTWSKSLGLPDLDRAAALRDAEDPYGFGELSLGGDAELPVTCAQRARLREQGYTPANTVEGQNDDAANVRCTTLDLLTRARPARKSYVRSLRWDATLLRVLPAALGSRIDPKRREVVDRASAAGQSLRALDPRARAKPGSAPSSLVVAEGDGNVEILVLAQAFGDFDADGVDDVVVSVTHADTHGPYREVRLFVLTRSQPDEVLRVLATY
jgi:hypothetical protein